MTIQEAHDTFRFRLDKTDSLNMPNFEQEEIDLLLNQAQDRVVKQRYGITNPKRQSFEETQKRTEDIKNIVDNAVIIPAVNNNNNIDINSCFITLPTDHWFIIQERCKIGYVDCKNNTVEKLVKVIPTEHNKFDLVIEDPFNKPNKNKVLRLMDQGFVELVFDPTVTIQEYRLRYLKQPIRVNYNTSTTFELSEHLHDEIIDEAVKIALEGIESRRTQTYPIIDNTKE